MPLLVVPGERIVAGGGGEGGLVFHLAGNLSCGFQGALRSKTIIRTLGLCKFEQGHAVDRWQELALRRECMQALRCGDGSDGIQDARMAGLCVVVQANCQLFCDTVPSFVQQLSMMMNARLVRIA
jgi:hypothetical protein